MKNLLTFLTVFFIATTLFAQKYMPENAGHKNLTGEDFRLDYHKNDIIHKQLLEEEKEHLQELKKNSPKTTCKGKANEQDSFALVALYNATDGIHWNHNTNWLTGNVSTWYGITLDGNGRVTEIDLFYNNLTGNIPAEIGNLTSLTLLYLDNNQLIGSIPAEIGNLTSLTLLYLFNNQLIGSIPAEIGNLTSLQYLALDNNQLTGYIPTEIGNLINLTGLWLDNNQLTGNIPTEIGNLINLTGLYLYGNQLTGSIPTEIGNLINLTGLYLYGNQLTGNIPAEIGNITNLKYLILDENQFEELPDLSALIYLSYCYVDNNAFDFGDLEIANITASYYFYSPQAQISAERSENAGQITFTVTVDGSNNQYQWFNLDTELTGETNNTLTVSDTEDGAYYCKITDSNFSDLTLTTIAEEVGNSGLTNGVITTEYNSLIALYNSTNGDNWTVNLNWKSSANVTEWYGITVSGVHVSKTILCFNQLTGSIPTEIGDLTSLTKLYLYGNQLTGSIPTEIGDLTSLTRLYLDDNQFDELPDLTTLINIDFWDIDNNKFTFEDIEPNIDVGNYFDYSPQAKIGSVEHYTPNAGDNLDLTVTVGGTANTYQWYKDDAAISGAVSSTYSITDYNSINDAGIYMCEIDNTIAAQLTLESRNIYVGTDVTTFEISATANPNESGTITGTGTYNDGATAELTAAPETGYLFVNWTEDGTIVSVDAVYSFKVDADRTLIANFESTVLIPELENNVSFTIYPIPARDIINIQLNNIEDNNIQLNMYDFYGRKININTDKFNTDQIQINISDKSPGIYYLQIISAGKISETVKLIITE